MVAAADLVAADLVAADLVAADLVAVNLVAHAGGMVLVAWHWWHGTGAPPWCWWLALHPAASGMGPPNSKRCGVTQLFVGPVPPNSPSCHWHRATNAYAGGLALVHHYCAST